MNYLEIIGKNLIHTQEVQDYIHWAMLKLEHGFETESIIALVSLLLEIFPDVVIAKQYFTQSIKETGLPYPSDKTAIYAYLQFYCDEVILGKIEPEYAVSELNEICENIKFNSKFKAIYHSAMVVWSELREDLVMFSMDEPSIYHTEFNHLNVDAYILKKVDQFKAVLSLDLS